MNAIATRSSDTRLTAAQVYATHRTAVFRLCLRYGGGRRAWAEDVTGDVFVTVLERLARLERHDDLGGWIYRVTTRHCLKRLRRDAVRRTFGLDRFVPRAGDADPERRATDRARLRHTVALLETLPPKQRVALCMHHLDGHTLDEVGAVLGHSRGYVCKLVKRAEARLRAADAEGLDD